MELTGGHKLLSSCCRRPRGRHRLNEGIAVESGLWLRYVRNTAIAVVVLFQSKWRVQILCALRSGPVRLGRLARLAFLKELVIVGSIASSRSGVAARQSVAIRMFRLVSSLERRFPGHVLGRRFKPQYQPAVFLALNDPRSHAHRLGLAFRSGADSGIGERNCSEAPNGYIVSALIFTSDFSRP